MTLVDGGLLHAAAGLACTELEAFKRDYAVEPVPRRQELRAGAVAWLAVMLPEAFDSTWARALEHWLWELHPEARDAHHWFRVPALRAAVSSWNDDPDAVGEVIANIDHHNSGLRSYVLECLAFVAPMLPFDDEDLRMRVESVLQKHYLYSASAIALLLATNGDGNAKTEWAKRWVDAVQESFGRDQLVAAINGAPVTNPLHEGLNEIERYALTGLLAHATAGTETLGTAEPGFDRVFVEFIRNRLREHPLMNPTFRIPE